MASSGTTTLSSGGNSANQLKSPPKNGERHTLTPQTELRLEVPTGTCICLTLLSGSAEIFGAELAPVTSDPMKQSYLIGGHAKFAIFTWHGCVIDVDVEFGRELDISYTSEETVANVAFVNTHAQLEAMRDEALMNGIAGKETEGPRVLVVGPADCGKSSLVKVLTSYAVKLGRSPLLVDLDTSQNMLSTPGTISASPMTLDVISPLTNASNTIYPSTKPLVLWYGSTELKSNPDLYKAQLDKLGEYIDARNSGSESHVVDARSSGIIVNGCGWIEDVGYKLMLHTVKALRINTVLVMGHDRLYSMLNSHYKKLKDADMNMNTFNGSWGENTCGEIIPKVIKLPRSGGVVSRDGTFRRVARSLNTKRYFYGESLRNPGVATTTGPVLCPAASSLIHEYTPTLLEIPFSDLTLYKLSSVSLSAAMLPVSAKQSTDAVQLEDVFVGPSLKHGILAVCHPIAVEKFKKSGEARDLYLSGMAGLVAVEKVDVDREIISLLSPGGSLPSSPATLLVGDITWIE